MCLFLFFNFFLFFTTTSYKSLLISLMVGTVTIHPLGFYLFTLIFFFKFYFLNNYFFVNKLKISFNNLSLALSLTLLLGGLWSSQSNSWGYFWVNDAVEWLLLLIIIYTIYYYHFWRNTYVINFFFVNFIFFNILILIRLNFLPTRHNFISSKLTVYFLLFLYNFILNLSNISYYFLKKSSNQTPLLLFSFTLFIISPLMFVKYVFFIFFIFFFKTQLNKVILAPTLHLIFTTFLFVWIIFYNFFFLKYNASTTINPFSLNLFKYNVHLSVTFFKYQVNYFLLEFVTFFFFWDSYFSNLTSNFFTITAILNNYILFYLLFVGLFLLKLVEFRFLYKKKTFI